MPTLLQWNLVLRQGVPLGVGIVSGHPKLTEGTDIHTSPVLRAEERDGGLVLETGSGSTYPLKLEEWGFTSGREEPLEPEGLGLAPDLWERCAKAREAALERRRAEQLAAHPQGTLSLRAVGTRILSALWTDVDALGLEIPVGVHPGMFQDSYLICAPYETASGTRRVDLRLFPLRNRLEPYRVCQGIQWLLIHNEGCTDLLFGRTEREILCPAGETTAISVSGENGRMGDP